MSDTKAYIDSFTKGGWATIMAPGLDYATSFQSSDQARQFRDKHLWDYPILPGAVIAYLDMAANREWTITGEKRAAQRAVEWLRRTKIYDFRTGITTNSFTEFVQRRALDYITLGKTAMYVPRESSEFLEYIDPSYLSRQNVNIGRPARKSDRIWKYADNREFMSTDISFLTAIGVGATRYIAPLTNVIPLARVAWLLREHDTTSLDGRKIRDVFFVSNPSMREGLSMAIQTQAALYNGADVNVTGIPVVELNNPSGTPIKDQIHTMGLSQIPVAFNRAEFIDYFVNTIAGALGISLRHFWNNEKTTNRALEEVQEARQQQKGPSAFVRRDQDVYNNSGVFDRFGPPGSVRFSYIEETDTSSRLVDAQVLKEVATALEKIRGVFGVGITLGSYLSWMQSLRLLPNDIELAEDVTFPQATVEEVAVDGVASNFPKPETAERIVSKSLPNYDEVVVDSSGNIIEARRKVFSVAKLIEQEDRQKAEDAVRYVDEQLSQDAMNQLVLGWVRDHHKTATIPSGIVDLYGREVINNVIKSAVAKETVLSDADWLILYSIFAANEEGNNVTSV